MLTCAFEDVAGDAHDQTQQSSARCESPAKGQIQIASPAAFADKTHNCRLQPANSAQKFPSTTLRSPSQSPASLTVELAAYLHSSALHL